MLAVSAAVEFLDQMLLRAEVVVGVAEGDARGLGDGAHGGALVAVLAEESERRLEDLCPRLLSFWRPASTARIRSTPRRRHPSTRRSAHHPTSASSARRSAFEREPADGRGGLFVAIAGLRSPSEAADRRAPRAAGYGRERRGSRTAASPG